MHHAHALDFKLRGATLSERRSIRHWPPPPVEIEVSTKSGQLQSVHIRRFPFKSALQFDEVERND
jgi:hypothetical protein